MGIIKGTNEKRGGQRIIRRHNKCEIQRYGKEEREGKR